MSDDAPSGVLCRVLRGGLEESSHRGTWVAIDGGGRVIAAYGDPDRPTFARSTLKSLQAVPLVRSGAAARFGVTDDELALALASHSGEPIHTDRVAAWLARLGLDHRALRCGAQPRPGLVPAGAETALHNNCSGKHAGFLTVARHLNVDPATYLDPDGEVHALVAAAVHEFTGTDPALVPTAVDGCNAVTYRLPLRSLARGVLQIALGACPPLPAAAAAYPEMVGGSSGRLCTELLRATGGALFPKLGAEGVYVAATARNGGVALAMTCDDGSTRGYEVLLVELLQRLELLTAAEAAAVAAWGDPTIRNWSGHPVGSVAVAAEALRPLG